MRKPACRVKAPFSGVIEPIRLRSKVVFPDPLGPITVRISADEMLKSTFCRTVRPFNATLRFFAVIKLIPVDQSDNLGKFLRLRSPLFRLQTLQNSPHRLTGRGFHPRAFRQPTRSADKSKTLASGATQ